MTTTHRPIASDYAAAYAQGRHAAQVHEPTKANPHRRGTTAHQAWTDGHYDELSARHREVERHNALLWA